MKNVDVNNEPVRNPDEFAKTLTELQERIKTLTAERDEARRMWCEAEAVGNCLSVNDMKQRARAEANRREWDCFKEASA
jgi:hypothetical protein